MSVELTASEEILNDNVDDIVHDIQKVVCDVNITNDERCKRVSVLLEEMEEYTQPLIQQIDALSPNAHRLILCRIARIFPEIIQKEIKSVVKIEDSNASVRSLHQNEIEFEQRDAADMDALAAEVTTLTLKSDVNEESTQNAEDLNKVLARLGYSDVDELYRHSKPTQIFGEFINGTLQRKASEKANSKKVDKQLDEWKRQAEAVEQKKLRDLKERKSIKIAKQAIIDCDDPPMPSKNNAQKVMMMMGGFENEHDVEAICNASSKARRKLI